MSPLHFQRAQAHPRCTLQCRPGHQRRHLPRRPAHPHLHGAPQRRPAAAAACGGVCTLPAGDCARLWQPVAASLMLCMLWCQPLCSKAPWCGAAPSCSFIVAGPARACHLMAATSFLAMPAGAKQRPLWSQQWRPWQRQHPQRRRPWRAVHWRPRLWLRPRCHGRLGAAPRAPCGQLLRGQPSRWLCATSHGCHAHVWPAASWQCCRPGRASCGARHSRLPGGHLLPSGGHGRLCRAGGGGAWEGAWLRQWGLG